MHPILALVKSGMFVATATTKSFSGIDSVVLKLHIAAETVRARNGIAANTPTVRMLVLEMHSIFNLYLRV